MGERVIFKYIIKKVIASRNIFLYIYWINSKKTHFMKKLLLLLTIFLTTQTYAQFSQSFEGSTTTPAGWSVISGGDPEETWEITDLSTSNTISAQNGTNTFSISYGTTAHNDILSTPQFTVTAGVSDKLTFWGRSRDPNYPETIAVVASTTTATLAAFTTVLNASIAPVSGANFYKYTIDLTSLVGQTIYVGFRSTTTDKFIFDVDNVVVGSILPCIEPTSALTFSAVTSNSASVSWAASSSAPAEGYDVYYSVAGLAPTALSVPNTSTSAGVTTANLTGLLPATKYYVYVRSKCSTTIQSVWGHLGVIITSFTPVAPPYAYGFDNPLGYVSDGWSGTWSTNATAGNPQAGTQMIFSNNSQSAVSNRWIISRPFTLEANSVNTITFYLRNFAATPVAQSLKLTVANTNVVADHTAIVWTSNTVNNSVWTQITTTYTPTVSGVYYFGFNHFSPIQASAVSLAMDTFAISSVLSTDEFKKNDFKVFPNPTQDLITISNSYNLIEKISITDVNGRVIRNINGNNNIDMEINISDLSAGMYLMTINSDNGSITKKIIKQ